MYSVIDVILSESLEHTQYCVSKNQRQIERSISSYEWNPVSKWPMAVLSGT